MQGRHVVKTKVKLKAETAGSGEDRQASEGSLREALLVEWRAHSHRWLLIKLNIHHFKVAV